VSFVRTLEDSCGCKMGATFVIAALLVSSVYFGWQYHAHGLSLSSVALRVFIVTVLAGGAGKLIGIGLFSLRRNAALLK